MAAKALGSRGRTEPQNAAEKSKNKNQVEAEIAKLKEQLAEAIDARTKAEEARDDAHKEAEAVMQAAEERIKKTEKSTDVRGSTMHDLVHQVCLDVQLEYHHQSARDLGDLFRMARRFQPYLSHFQNDWATAKLVKQYLSNRRKSDSHKRRLQSSALEQTGKHHRTNRAASGDDELADVEDEGDGAGEENRDN